MSAQELILEQAEVIQEMNTESTSFTTLQGNLEVLRGLISSILAKPIEQNDKGEVIFHPSLMVKDQYYEFDFKNKPYLLKKSDEQAIDIYEVKE